MKVIPRIKNASDRMISEDSLKAARDGGYTSNSYGLTAP
jgi:hypothetical protein